jgi:hypothetical protein
MCWSGSSPVGCISIQIAVTLSDMSGRLSVANILWYILLHWIDGLEHDYGYDYVYHGYYYIN